MAKPDAGYNEPFDDTDKCDPVVFRAEEFKEQYISSGVLLKVTRNDEGVGTIRVKNQDELRWLVERVNGTFEPED